MKKRRYILYTALLGLMITACTNDVYEAGNGVYSYLKADFGMIYSNEAGMVERFVDDDDETVFFAEPFSASNIKADTVYRALVYYDANGDEKIKMRSVALLNVCSPSTKAVPQNSNDDPLHWDTAWMSNNGTFLNLGIRLMVGVDVENEQKVQKIGVHEDCKTLGPTGKHRVVLRLLHNQNEVPQHYSYPTYVSVPMEEYEQGDTIELHVNTYEGEKKRVWIK